MIQKNILMNNTVTLWRFLCTKLPVIPCRWNGLVLFSRAMGQAAMLTWIFGMELILSVWMARRQKKQFLVKG